MRSFHTSNRIFYRFVSNSHHDGSFSAREISMDREPHLPVYTAPKGKWKALYRTQIFSPSWMGELKNPVHGDRNNVDDVSWPFYNAIDEVLGYDRGSTPIGDEYIDPHEFLCVSVTPEEPTSSVDALPAQSNPEIDRRINDSFPERRLRALSANCTIEIQKVRPSGVNRQMNKNLAKRKRTTRNVAVAIPRLPRATELTIEKVTSEADCIKDLSRLRGRDAASTQEDKERLERNEDEGMPRKSRKSRMAAPYRDDRDSRTDRRIEQIFEYIKRRDEENRSIMVRVMHAVESIANKL
ncbi:uncharacterized protein LOC117160745 isoform X2 [Bombus vancouverensis nearcticus]|uniref:Uncharacterized protein LOC117209100 isoform X3 n=1 Tax=Bombus bifarius TaxID=103933 RepID=A0A6P8M9T4_9HYME|nr:uncharacterized protein LOC117209100 isoform X3 [Bombus bifarius]